MEKKIWSSLKDEKEHPPSITSHSQHSKSFSWSLRISFFDLWDFLRAIDKIIKRKILNISSDKHPLGQVIQTSFKKHTAGMGWCTTSSQTAIIVNKLSSLLTYSLILIYWFPLNCHKGEPTSFQSFQNLKSVTMTESLACPPKRHQSQECYL